MVGLAHNTSVVMVENARDFHCCCSISRDEYDTNGSIGLYIFNSIFLVLTSLSATVGNFLVLVSIWRTPCLHSPSNVLLFGLAVSDLGVGLVVEPTAFVYSIAKMNGLARTFCISAIPLWLTCILLCCASLLTVTAISLDLYIALYLHLRYKEVVTVKTMTGVLIGIWLFSITFSLIYLWYSEIVWMIWASLIVLCLLVTTYTYYKVFRIVRHHQLQIQVQVAGQAEDQDEDPLTEIAQQKKSLMAKFLIYCLLVLCYLPYILMVVLRRCIRHSSIIQSLSDISFSIMYLNSTLNPFVYCWRLQAIRAALIQTAMKLLGK